MFDSHELDEALDHLVDAAEAFIRAYRAKRALDARKADPNNCPYCGERATYFQVGSRGTCVTHAIGGTRHFTGIESHSAVG